MLCALLSVVESRKTASQRETELVQSADQCRAMLEDQVSSLRKQVASMEADLSSTREDLKENQQQLRRKVRVTGSQLCSHSQASPIEEKAWYPLRVILGVQNGKINVSNVHSRLPSRFSCRIFVWERPHFSLHGNAHIQ